MERAMSLTDAMTKIAALAIPADGSDAVPPPRPTRNADIFISYASADRALAETLESTLAADGYGTWWAGHLLAGEAQHRSIIAALEKARAVIVVWTAVSIGSDWVYSEAEYARGRAKLVPLRAEGLSHAAIPPPFNTCFTLDFGDQAGLRAALDRLGVRPRLPA
jgi:hypothetical protein